MIESESRNKNIRRFAPVCDLAISFGRKLNYEISLESQENLALHKEHLKTGSIVEVINHLGPDDPFYALSITLNHLGSVLQGGLLPMGAHHYKRYTQSRIAQAALRKLESKFGFIIAPVPQHYYEPITIDDGKTLFIADQSLILESGELSPDADEHMIFTNSEMRQMIVDFRSNAQAVLSCPGTICIIAPEATRSHDATLQAAQSGVEKLDKYGKNVAFSTWTINPHGSVDRDKGFRSAEIIISKPQTLEQIEEDWLNIYNRKTPFQHMLMFNIAANLPLHMQGAYADPPYVLK